MTRVSELCRNWVKIWGHEADALQPGNSKCSTVPTVSGRTLAILQLTLSTGKAHLACWTTNDFVWRYTEDSQRKTSKVAAHPFYRRLTP